jgi:hypothetical protein
VETRWAAYQNHDIGDPESVGLLKFLAVGPKNSFQEPPRFFPSTRDLAFQADDPFVFVGYVDLGTGDISTKGS